MADSTPRLLDWLKTNMSCKNFAHHVASEEPLTNGLYGRFHFWLHWAICPFCRRYWKEIQMIGKLQRSMSRLANHPVVKINALKERLKENVGKRYS